MFKDCSSKWKAHAEIHMGRKTSAYPAPQDDNYKRHPSILLLLRTTSGGLARKLAACSMLVLQSDSG